MCYLPLPKPPLPISQLLTHFGLETFLWSCSLVLCLLTKNQLLPSIARCNSKTSAAGLLWPPHYSGTRLVAGIANMAKGAFLNLVLTTYRLPQILVYLNFLILLIFRAI